MRVPGRPPVLPDLVEEHFDELDWLWEHRDANVFSPDWTLADLAFCEERAEAHRDGLRLAEGFGIDLARARLGCGEPSAALAATLVLGADPTRSQLDAVRDALRNGDAPVLDGVRRALRHELPEELLPLLQELAGGTDPLRAAAALDVLAFRRLPARLPPDLPASDDAAVSTLALGAARRFGAVPEPALRRAFDHTEASVRDAALHAAAHTGHADLLAVCRTNAGRATDPDAVAVRWLGVLGEAEDLALLRACLDRPELAAHAVQALGALGRVEAVPLLLDLLADAKLGTPAAKAYLRLCGSDAAFGPRPFPPPQVAEGDDEDEDLPPSPAAARADWQRRAASMPADATWQHGQRIPTDALPTAFDDLPLDSRRDVWLRQRARNVAVPDLELEAQALRQRR